MVELIDDDHVELPRIDFAEVKAMQRLDRSEDVSPVARAMPASGPSVWTRAAARTSAATSAIGM
jgi:hypothetical protein